MRASRCAAVGVVTKGVDVHATLGVGVVASDVPADGGRVGLGGLLKGDSTSDLGVTADDANCRRPKAKCQRAVPEGQGKGSVAKARCYKER